MIKLFTLICFIFFVQYCYSQQRIRIVKFLLPDLCNENLNNVTSLNDSTRFLIIPRICKNNNTFFIFKTQTADLEPAKIQTFSEEEPLIKIHGNILYNFSYRSYLDTPFAQSGLMQHLVLTSLNFTLKEKYPVKMEIGLRNSNSPYFRNSIDVNVVYQQRQMLDIIKDDLRKRIPGYETNGLLSEAENKYKKNLIEARELRAWINNPARVQEIIEEKERGIVKNELPGKNISFLSGGVKLKDQSLNDLENPGNYLNKKGNRNLNDKKWMALIQKLVDSTKEQRLKIFQKTTSKDSSTDASNSIQQKINIKKETLVKLEERIKTEGIKIREIKKSVQDSLNNIKREISSLNNTASLYDFMKRNGISRDSLTKTQKVLLSVNQIGIGRIFLDYSELTVKNVSLTGFNVEANPGNFYFAIATGKVNYRFRDFIFKKGYRNPPQSLNILRAGIGKKEKNNFIISFYDGKKNELFLTSSNNTNYSNKILGISAEAKFTLDPNNYIVAEVAKSSYNNSGILQSNSSLLKKAIDLKSHTNEAYSIKLFSQYPSTGTKLTAFYRKMGENFQSFNLYPTHVNEEAWMIKLNQNVWERKLYIEAAIRKNDFNSPVAAPSSYSAKTIFKSIQATLRIPKYPFVSLGYYPSSQLSISDDNILVENQYNTLNAVLSYGYKIKKHSMNSTAVYTEFFNNSTDTAFLYFNARTFSFSHSVFISALTSQSGLSVTKQKNIDLLTLEEVIGYRIKNNFSLSAGLKWNKLNRMESLWGGTAGVSFLIKKVGTFQFNYDKAFLPGYKSALMPVDMGRMNFYKVF